MLDVVVPHCPLDRDKSHSQYYIRFRHGRHMHNSFESEFKPDVLFWYVLAVVFEHLPNLSNCWPQATAIQTIWIWWSDLSRLSLTSWSCGTASSMLGVGKASFLNDLDGKTVSSDVVNLYVTLASQNIGGLRFRSSQPVDTRTTNSCTWCR